MLRCRRGFRVQSCIASAGLIGLSACGSSSHKAQTVSTTVQAATTTSSTTIPPPAPTTNTPVTVSPTAPAATTTPSTKRTNYCDISATWTPRDSRGLSTLQLSVTSDEPSGKVSGDIRDTKSRSDFGLEGEADSNGVWATNTRFARPPATEAVIVGAAIIYVRILTPQYTQCTLLSQPPP